MSERQVVLVCHESGLAATIVKALDQPGVIRVSSVAEVHEAIELIEQEEFRLILVYVNGAVDQNKADALLWSASTVRRPVPVVALCQRYDEAAALVLFQMGVTDFLSLSDHRDRLADVVASLLNSTASADAASDRPARADKSVRSRVTSRIS